MQIDEYLNDIKEDFAPSSIEGYRKDLNQLSRFISDAEPVTENIKQYRHHLEERGASRSHIVRVLYSIKGYCDWQGWDIFCGIRDRSKDKVRIPPMEFRQPPRTRTVEEVQKLMAASQSPLEVAIVMLLASTGTRIGELMGIEIKDVDWEQGTIAVTRKGKRRRKQVLSLSLVLMDVLKTYYEWRKPQGKLFPYSYQELRTWFVSMAKRAGVTFPAGSLFHNLRHFNVLFQKRAGTPLEVISMSVGHSSTHTTDRIYGALEPEEIRQQLEPFPWEKE